MKERENGWNLKASGYMTAEPSYQKIRHKKACDAIELGHAITFVKVADGSVVSKRTYVPESHADVTDGYEAGYMDGLTHYELEHCPACKNVTDLQDALAENAKLREFAKNAYRHICVQEGYLRNSGYDSFDYFDTVAHELGVEVE